MKVFYFGLLMVAKAQRPCEFDPCYDGTVDEQCEKDCVRWCTEQGDPDPCTGPCYTKCIGALGCCY